MQLFASPSLFHVVHSIIGNAGRSNMALAMRQLNPVVKIPSKLIPLAALFVSLFLGDTISYHSRIAYSISFPDRDGDAHHRHFRWSPGGACAKLQSILSGGALKPQEISGLLEEIYDRFRRPENRTSLLFGLSKIGSEVGCYAKPARRLC